MLSQEPVRNVRSGARPARRASRLRRNVRAETPAATALASGQLPARMSLATLSAISGVSSVGLATGGLRGGVVLPRIEAPWGADRLYSAASDPERRASAGVPASAPDSMSSAHASGSRLSPQTRRCGPRSSTSPRSVSATVGGVGSNASSSPGAAALAHHRATPSGRGAVRVAHGGRRARAGAPPHLVRSRVARRRLRVRRGRPGSRRGRPRRSRPTGCCP